MGKQKQDIYARNPGETSLTHKLRIARIKADARDRDQPLVSDEARQHGDYRQEFVTHVESNTKTQTTINRGGTTICRWIDRERLSQTQEAAIGYVTRLWALAGLRTALTANYGERLSGGGNAEMRANCEIDARRDLHRIQDYVPAPYWSVFENVVRHGIEAGTAGEVLGHASRNARHTAYLTVCFVADVIAQNERL